MHHRCPIPQGMGCKSSMGVVSGMCLSARANFTSFLSSFVFLVFVLLGLVILPLRYFFALCAQAAISTLLLKCTKFILSKCSSSEKIGELLDVEI